MGRVTLPKGFNPSSERNWFLVANRVEACIYEGRPGRGFRFVKRLSNPKGKLTNLQLVSDRPGVSFSSNRGSSLRHGFAPRSDYHEVVAQNFARKLGRVLRQAVLKGEFSRLTLVAEPHFLGLLKSSLSPQVEAALANSVPHEWHEGSDKELEAYLKKKLA